MATSKKSDLIERVLSKQLGSFASWSMPEEPPLLGQRYRGEIGVLRQKTNDFIGKHRQLLRFQDMSDLSLVYDEYGETLDQEMKKHWREIRQSSPVSSQTVPILLAGLGKPGLVADFGYWSRMEWIELNEALWLCVGLDPRVDWADLLAHHSARRPGYRQALEHSNAQLKQLSRFAVRVDAIGKKFRGPELLDWIEKSRFPAHPDCIEMLRIKVARDFQAKSPLPKNMSTAQPKREDPRAVRAVAKIITAIAIEEYGYDPNSVRSPIPNEILDIMDRLGLDSTAETILKYLKIGASDLPDDWDAK